MAKIGNEAKLILKLAKERAEKRLTDLVIPVCENAETDFEKMLVKQVYYSGFERAHRDWLATLDQVVSEIETK